MAAVRVHRLSGRYVAVVEERPSGVGPLLWVGEVRTVRNEPVRGYVHSIHGTVREQPAAGLHTCWPVTFGSTEGAVLAQLQARSERLTRTGR